MRPHRMPTGICTDGAIEVSPVGFSEKTLQKEGDTMKQTSIVSFHNLNRHKVDSQYGRILALIKDSEVSLNDRRIAWMLKLPVNIVESRLCQLFKEGLIVEDGVKFDAATGNHSRTWRLKQ